MVAVTLQDRPLVTIGTVQVSDGPLWDLLADPKARFARVSPFVPLRYLPKDAPSRENGYNPPNNPDTQNVVPLFPIKGSIPDECFLVIATKRGYYGYGNTEDYFAPLWPTGGGKFLALKFENVSGTAKIYGYHPISGGFSVGKDFLPGAALAVAIAVTANTIGAAVAAPSTAAATPWEIATAGMGEGMGSGGVLGAVTSVPTAATPWEIATAGMGEGMGSGGIIGSASAAVAAGSPLATVGQTLAGAVKTAESVAGAVVATRAAVDTITAAASAPAQQNATPNPPESNAMVWVILLGTAIMLS